MHQKEEEKVDMEEIVGTDSSEQAKTEALSEWLYQTWPRHHGSSETTPPESKTKKRRKEKGERRGREKRLKEGEGQEEGE